MLLDLPQVLQQVVLVPQEDCIKLYDVPGVQRILKGGDTMVHPLHLPLGVLVDRAGKGGESKGEMHLRRPHGQIPEDQVPPHVWNGGWHIGGAFAVGTLLDVGRDPQPAVVKVLQEVVGSLEVCTAADDQLEEVCPLHTQEQLQAVLCCEVGVVAHDEGLAVQGDTLTRHSVIAGQVGEQLLPRVQRIDPGDVGRKEGCQVEGETGLKVADEEQEKE